MKVAEEEIIGVDREFSALSVKEGIHKAFDFFMEEQAVLYRDKMYPIKGRDAIGELLNNPKGLLKWEPFH